MKPGPKPKYSPEERRRRSVANSMKWNRKHQTIVNARICEVKKRNPEKYDAIDKAWREKNATSLKQYYKDYHQARESRFRQAVFAFYGGDNPRCVCCGEGHREFLTIDHTEGNGAEHRKEIGCGHFYSWLVKNNFPDGFRILCMNCNWSMGRRGYCPHQVKEV